MGFAGSAEFLGPCFAASLFDMKSPDFSSLLSNITSKSLFTHMSCPESSIRPVFFASLN